MGTRKKDVRFAHDGSSGETFIPEVYFCEEKEEVDTESGACDSALEAGQGQAKKDLGEGFIPMSEFNVCHLPEEIRTFKNYFCISDIAKRVVCIFNPKLSEKRPEAFRLQTKGSKGTGFLLWISDGYAIVSTNKHVLYNNEEIKKAKLYLDYDRPLAENGKVNPNVKTVKSGSGLGALRGNVGEDFTLALFSFNHSLPEAQIPVMMHQIPVVRPINPQSFLKTVCVISHPLGEPKQISFGRVLVESLESGLFQHNAPTHPGSSGAPIVVFSPTRPEVPPNSIWYHISRNPKTGVKNSRLQVNDSELFEMNIDFVGQTDVLSASPDVRRAVEEKVYGSMNYIRLMSHWTCLGRAALQPDGFLGKVQEGALKDCGESSLDSREVAEHHDEMTMKFLSKSYKKYKNMTEHFLETFGEGSSGGNPAAKSLLRQLIDSSDEDEDDDAFQSSVFLQLLRSTRKCLCQSFTKLVSSDMRLHGIETGAPFLSPYAEPRRLSQNPTWPFGLRNLQKNVSAHAVNQCLLQRLRKPLCKLQPLAEVKADDSFDDSFDETGAPYIEEILGTVMISQVAGDLFPRRTPGPKGRGLPGFARSSPAPTRPPHVVRLEERTQECLDMILDILEEFVKVLDVDGAILIVICNNFFNRQPSDPPLQTDDSPHDAGNVKQSEADVQLESDEEIDQHLGERPRATKRMAQQTAWIKKIHHLLNIRHDLAQDDLKSLVSHAMQHYRQDHKDAEDCEERGCGCGRPSLKGLLKAIKHIRELHQDRFTQQPRTKVGQASSSEVKLKAGDINGCKGRREMNTPLKQGVFAQGPDRGSASADKKNVRFLEADASPLNAFMHRDGREFERRAEADDDHQFVPVRNNAKRSQPADNVRQREQSRHLREIPDYDTDSESESPLKRGDAHSSDSCDDSSDSETEGIAKDFTLRKIVSQSHYAFLFHQKMVKEEDSDDEDDSWLLEANILSLRRLFIVTEVFLYNCQQFLSCFHSKLGCYCEALHHAPKYPPRHCQQDQHAASRAKAERTAQAQAKHAAELKSMADLVCSLRKLPTPVRSGGHRESGDTRPPIVAAREGTYEAVEDVQVALRKVVAEFARSPGFLHAVANMFESEDRRCFLAVMSAPETLNIIWQENIREAFEDDDTLDYSAERSDTDDESDDVPKSVEKHLEKRVLEKLKQRLAGTVTDQNEGPVTQAPQDEDMDFYAKVLAGWKRTDKADCVMNNVMQAKLEHVGKRAATNCPDSPGPLFGKGLHGLMGQMLLGTVQEHQPGDNALDSAMTKFVSGVVLEELIDVFMNGDGRKKKQRGSASKLGHEEDDDDDEKCRIM